jgi:hypothetical protein
VPHRLFKHKLNGQFRCWRAATLAAGIAIRYDLTPCASL